MADRTAVALAYAIVFLAAEAFVFLVVYTAVHV